MSARYYIVLENMKWCAEDRKPGDIIHLYSPTLEKFFDKKATMIINKEIIKALDNHAAPYIFQRRKTLRGKEYNKSDFIFFTYKAQAKSLGKAIRPATNDEYREYLLKLVDGGDT